MRTTKYHASTAASVTALAKRIMETNLCKEIMLSSPVTMELGVFYAPYIPNFMTKPKYQFSRAKWYVAEYDWINYSEVGEWCRQQFGPHPRYPDAWSRWVHNYEGQIHFRDAKDYEWFILRWS